jgi:hypothetical protein
MARHFLTPSKSEVRCPFPGSEEQLRTRWVLAKVSRSILKTSSSELERKYCKVIFYMQLRYLKELASFYTTKDKARELMSMSSLHSDAQIILTLRSTDAVSIIGANGKNLRNLIGGAVCFL